MTLQIVYRALADLKAHPGNARTHDEAQVAQIAASMREFGATNPILIDEDDWIIAGHGRKRGAALAGIDPYPTVTLRGLSPSQRRAYLIADNRIALGAGWDEDLLRQELGELKALGFDLGLTGFELGEIAVLMAEGNGPAPAAAPVAPENPVSVLGDVWLCGAHRIMCGSGTDLDQVKALCAGAVPGLANCDPPYGIEIVKRSAVGGPKAFGKVGGHQHRRGNDIGSVHSRGQDGFRAKGQVHAPARRAIIMPGTYAPIIGDDTTETAILSHAVLVALGVPAIVMWGGNYYADALPASRCWLVWDKENSGSFADVELAWTNQDAVARLFRHQWNGLLKASEHGERRSHPTQKPVALAEWVMETVAPSAVAVLDLFLGSAPTLIAAQRRGVTLFGMELAPAYVDVAVLRWSAETGQGATLEATGQSFAQVAQDRLGLASGSVRSDAAICSATPGAVTHEDSPMTSPASVRLPKGRKTKPAPPRANEPSHKLAVVAKPDPFDAIEDDSGTGSPETIAEDEPKTHAYGRGAIVTVFNASLDGRPLIESRGAEILAPLPKADFYKVSITSGEGDQRMTQVVDRYVPTTGQDDPDAFLAGAVAEWEASQRGAAAPAEKPKAAAKTVTMYDIDGAPVQVPGSDKASAHPNLFATKGHAREARRAAADRAKAKAGAAPRPAPRAAAAPKAAGGPNKKQIATDMLRRKEGATAAEIGAVTDWQAHSVRGFIGGTVRKLPGVADIRTEKDKTTGLTRYWIVPARAGG